MKKVSFYTLGCKVNQYETQALKEKFESNGYEVVDENQLSDVYIVNSCSVTGISDRKTRQYIRKTKRLNPEAITALIGCYAETGSDKVSQIDEVDIILGTAEKSRILEEIETLLISDSKHLDNNHEEKTDRETSLLLQRNKIVKTGGVNSISVYDDYGLVSGMDSRTRAYIKIEDGCDRFCSYCTIPLARGPVRSRPIESIINEAKTLLSKGYKELVLTGINAALFGSDTDGDLISLIEEISDIPKNSHIEDKFRIRLSSLEPTVINDEYAKRLIEIPKLCPHLHLSLQSGSDKVLKEMKRRYSRKEYLDIIKVLKDFDPNYSITTDMIVGFPGENERDFSDSMSIVQEVGFSKVHVFKYSKRAGTVAAEMPNQVQEQIKNQRSKELIAAAEREAARFINCNKGTKREVLILEKTGNHKIYHGITDNDMDVEVESSTDISNKFLDIVVR
jgi:threonylcarbamoyladenosine tRNA methylthiotransferase MtaB